MRWRSTLERNGFEELGHILRPGLWLFWNPTERIELHVIDLGACVLSRGLKSYFVKGRTEEGEELWARRIEELQESLTTYFASVRVSFCHFRDISRLFTIRRIREKNFRELGREFEPGVNEARLRQVRAEFEKKREEIANKQADKHLDAISSLKIPGLTSMLREGEARLRQEASILAEEGKTLARKVGIEKALLRAYQRDGSAAGVHFLIATESRPADTEAEFRDSTLAAVKELRDLHRFQIRQKLSQLRLPIEESTDPFLDFMGLWSGFPDPGGLEKAGRRYEDLQRRTEDRLILTPIRDIIVDGARKDEKKVLAPRIVRAFLRRLPKVPATPKRPEVLTSLPRKGKLAWIGYVMVGSEVTDTPFMLPLDQMLHVYISARTGGGKSFLARVLAEGAIILGINVLILDPRNQAIGLLVPEDRSEVLERYPEFGLARSYARGFAANYHAPGLGLGGELPEDLSALAQGTNVVSFKGLENVPRCELFSHIVESVFHAHTAEEHEGIKTFMLIEEARLFTKKRLPKKEKPAGERAENAIDLVTREGRKYGLYVGLVSQTIMDYSHSVATIRQNTTTKIFLGNSDNEIEHASECLADGRAIVGLPPAEAITFNPTWDEVRVKVRPPLSKVWEPAQREAEGIVGTHRAPGERVALSREEHGLLDAARVYHRTTGQYINLGQAGQQLGVSSKRRMLALVGRLVQKGCIRVEETKARGRPKLIVPLDEMADGTRAKLGPYEDHGDHGLNADEDNHRTDKEL